MSIILHSKPDINSADAAAVNAVLATAHLAQGHRVLEFEKNLSQYVGVKGAVAVNSGTSALHLALLSLGVGKDDQVIIPSFVCTALLNAVMYVGATPVIADVDPDDFNISAASVKARLTKKTKAIIVPHMFGAPSDIVTIAKLGAPVIEDCAQALGGLTKGRKLGSSGTLSICSFYATKMIGTGEGGMVLSDQKKLLDRIRDLREYDNVSDFKVRYNYKMTDLAAALGISQLNRLDGFISRRQSIAQEYNQALKDTDVILPSGAGHVYFRYVIRLKRDLKGTIKKFQDRGIHVAQPVYKALHQYLGKAKYPVSDQLMRQSLSIPIYPALTNAQVKTVSQALSTLFRSIK